MSVDSLPQPGQALGMRTVILGEMPPEVEALIAQRQRLGQDRHDELWNGDYHLAPLARGEHSYLEVELARVLGPRAELAGLIWTNGVNVGTADNYRGPDGVAHRSVPRGLYFESVAIAAGVLSPSDETFLKFEHYFDHGVEELLVVDVDIRRVRVWVRSETEFVESDRSGLLGVTTAQVESEIRWI